MLGVESEGLSGNEWRKQRLQGSQGEERSEQKDCENGNDTGTALKMQRELTKDRTSPISTYIDSYRTFWPKSHASEKRETSDDQIAKSCQFVQFPRKG